MRLRRKYCSSANGVPKGKGSEDRVDRHGVAGERQQEEASAHHAGQRLRCSLVLFGYRVIRDEIDVDVCGS